MPQYNATEQSRFEGAVGKSILEVTKEYDREIYLQGNTITNKNTRPFVCLFATIKSTYNPPKREQGLKIEKITVPPEYDGLMSSVSTDLNTPPSASDRILYYCNKTLVAVVDTNDNIFFIDFARSYIMNSNLFAHRGVKDFAIFDWVMQDFLGVANSTAYLERLEKALHGIDADRIERVKIETTFDKDKYIADAMRKFELAVAQEKSIAESRTNSLQRTIERERATVSSRMAEASSASFLEGLKSLKDGWTFREGRLFLDKRIPVKKLQWKGRSIDVSNIPDQKDKFFVDKLSITVQPTISHASAEQAFHPNCSNTESRGDLCIGDLAGVKLTDFMSKIEKQMEVAHLDNPWGGTSTRAGTALFTKADEDTKNKVADPIMVAKKSEVFYSNK